jgi:hypothetical protein
MDDEAEAEHYYRSTIHEYRVIALRSMISGRAGDMQDRYPAHAVTRDG